MRHQNRRDNHVHFGQMETMLFYKKQHVSTQACSSSRHVIVALFKLSSQLKRNGNKTEMKLLYFSHNKSPKQP